MHAPKITGGTKESMWWFGLMIFHLYNLFFNSARTAIVYPLLLGSAAWLLWRQRITWRFFLDPIGVGLVCFLAVALVSNLVNGLPSSDIMQAVWFLYPYYWGKYLVADNAMRPQEFFLLFIAFSAVFALLVVVGHYGLGIESLAGKVFIRPDDGRLVFTFKYPVRVGLYLGTALFFCLHYILGRKSSLRRGICLCILMTSYLICIFMSQDRTTFILISLMTVGIFLAYRRIRLLLWAAVAAVVLVLVLGFGDRMLTKPGDFLTSRSMVWRYSFWEVSARFFAEDPVLGKGYNSFQDLYRSYVHEQRDNLIFQDIDPKETAPHNVNFSLLAQTGILGWLAMNSAFFFSIWGFWRYRSRDPALFFLMLTMLFYYLVMQMNVLLHSHHSSKLVFLIMGLVGGCLYGNTGNGVQNILEDKKSGQPTGDANIP